MTKETCQEAQGGARKFLYAGPKRKGVGAGFESDADEDVWNYTSQSSPRPPQENSGILSPEFDFNDVWSIRQNVDAAKTDVVKPSVQEGWNMNISKGFYSRHGGLNDDRGRYAESNTGSGVNGKNWNNGARTYSYSNSSGPSGSIPSPRQTSLPVSRRGHHGNPAASQPPQPASLPPVAPSSESKSTAGRYGGFQSTGLQNGFKF